jgi:hypothetical protein
MKFDELRKIVWTKTNGSRAYCGCDLDINSNWEIEHMQPRSKGGQNVLENYLPSCRRCNNKKRDRNVNDFRQQISYSAMDIFYDTFKNKHVDYLLKILPYEKAMTAIYDIQAAFEKNFSEENIDFYFERLSNGKEDLD